MARLDKGANVLGCGGGGMEWESQRIKVDRQTSCTQQADLLLTGNGTIGAQLPVRLVQSRYKFQFFNVSHGTVGRPVKENRHPDGMMSRRSLCFDTLVKADWMLLLG